MQPANVTQQHAASEAQKTAARSHRAGPLPYVLTASLGAAVALGTTRLLRCEKSTKPLN